MGDGIRTNSGPTSCAGAGQSFECASYVQKLEEMRRLSANNTWKGVESAYQEILAIKGIAIETEVYWLAVQAARALGDAAQAYERLSLLLQNEPGNKDAQDWLSDLNAHYGCVEISLPEGEKYTVSITTQPFAPDQRKAIKFAQHQLESEGHFKGLLPVIEYTLTPIGQAGRYETKTFTPASIASQGEATDYLEVIPAKIQQTKTQEKKHPLQKHIWFSASGGYGYLAKADSAYYKGGPVFFGDVIAQLRPEDVPLQIRFSAGAGWFSSTAETENLSTVPLRGTFGVDFVNDRKRYFSLGPTVGVEQNLGTKGVLSVGTNEVVMTDPALQPHTFIYGGRLMMGGNRVSIIVDYTHGLTEIRGLLPDYDNVVGTTNRLAENQWTAGFAVRAF